MRAKKIFFFSLLLVSSARNIFPATTDNPPPLRFAVMGCAHLGACDPKDYELAAKKIKEQAPDFVVFLGGMVDIFRAKELEDAWRKFDAITASLGVPVYNATSDCSLNPLAVSSGTMKLAQKMYSNRYKKRFYSFEHMNNLFILLDSGANGIYGEQLQFLKSTLKRAARYDNVFVFLNRTPLEDSTGSIWFKVIHPLLINKVKYVFTASAHYLNFEKNDGINYVTSGSPSCQQTAMRHPSFFHFLLATVTNGNVSVNVVPVKHIPIEYLGRRQKKSSGPKYLYPGIKPDTLDAADRKRMLPPDIVVKSLNIKPGIKILDVGAGTGFFTFPFAKELGETGKVFATDTDPEIISSLEKKTKEAGHRNVVPVRVIAEGVDQFYKSGTFDIIFLSEMYHYLWHPIDYFRELRPSLVKETGRLYIIHFKNVHDFDEIEFGDFMQIFQQLKTLGDGSPVFRKVAAGIEDYVRNWQGAEIPTRVRKTITSNFNKILADRAFLNELLDSYPAKEDDLEWVRGKPLLKLVPPPYLELAKWLIAELDERGVFDEGENRFTEDEDKYLRTLNRILLVGIFRITKINFLKGDSTLYAGKNRIISDMEAAGYKFVREHDLFTYHHFLEFR